MQDAKKLCGAEGSSLLATPLTLHIVIWSVVSINIDKCRFNIYLWNWAVCMTGGALFPRLGENELLIWRYNRSLSLSVMCCWVFKTLCWLVALVHHSAFSHVIHFAWWNWMWLNCSVKYTFSSKITWRPSFSHWKADMPQQNWCYLLWLVINQPMKYWMLNSFLAVCYEMRSRCDVSCGPNQMGAMGLERWNSIYFGEVFMLWSV